MIELFGLCCISLLWIYSYPTILFRRWIGFKEEEDYIGVKGFINRLITCAFCSSFWIGTIFTGNILLGAIISVSTLFLEKKVFL